MESRNCIGCHRCVQVLRAKSSLEDIARLEEQPKVQRSNVPVAMCSSNDFLIFRAEVVKASEAELLHKGFEGHGIVLHRGDEEPKRFLADQTGRCLFRPNTKIPRLLRSARIFIRQAFNETCLEAPIWSSQISPVLSLENTQLHQISRENATQWWHGSSRVHLMH